MGETIKGKYIYCLIRKPKSFSLNFCGLDGRKIDLITFEKLAVVVSDSPIKDYPITRENTMTHQLVIEEIMRRYSPVLPVSFGTIAENSKVLQEKVLEAKEDELVEALDEIEGKVELNLKAIWLDMPKVFQKVVLENPELEQMKRALSGRILGRDEGIEIGKLVASGIESRRERLKEAILSLVKNIIVDHKETPLLGEEMVFNLAFLIPENKQKRFDKIVRNLDEKYKEENIYFKYIGPIPPFNFIKVKVLL